MLFGVYVLVCVYCFVLFCVDLEWFVVVDSWLFSIFLGCVVVMVVEICFVL